MKYFQIELSAVLSLCLMVIIITSVALCNYFVSLFLLLWCICGKCIHGCNLIVHIKRKQLMQATYTILFFLDVRFVFKTFSYLLMSPSRNIFVYLLTNVLSIFVSDGFSTYFYKICHWMWSKYIQSQFKILRYCIHYSY